MRLNSMQFSSTPLSVSLPVMKPNEGLSYILFKWRTLLVHCYNEDGALVGLLLLPSSGLFGRNNHFLSGKVCTHTAVLAVFVVIVQTLKWPEYLLYMTSLLLSISYNNIISSQFTEKLIKRKYSLFCSVKNHCALLSNPFSSHFNDGFIMFLQPN